MNFRAADCRVFMLIIFGTCRCSLSEQSRLVLDRSPKRWNSSAWIIVSGLESRNSEIGSIGKRVCGMHIAYIKGSEVQRCIQTTC